MDVLIIGGSLSGLTLALACAQHGIRTKVLERGSGLNRGGALGIDPDQLIRATRNPPGDGTEIIPFPAIAGRRKAVTWHALHSWLRARALQSAEITLVDDVTVSEIEQTTVAATAVTAGFERIKARLIVGADGHRSIVRRSINPEQPNASYAGYLLWRGLIHEAALPTSTRLPQNNDGVALVNRAGYRLVAYPVARPGGSLNIGERLISFAWYDAGRENLLRVQHCHDDEESILNSLAPENIPSAVIDELYDLTCRIWPNPWRAAILHTLECRSVFATPVAEYSPIRLQNGRLVIIGDAAHVVSPITGKGFAAGVLDAESLAKCLAQAAEPSEEDVSLALSAYEKERLPEAQALAAASSAWSQTFVRDFSAAAERVGDPCDRKM